MVSRVSESPVWQQWKTSKRLVLLAAFEDSVTGTRVKEFCQDFSRHLGRQCQIIEHVWLFSTLRHPELQAIAAEEALAADLIVISVHQTEGLPDEVRRWMELWLRQKSSRPAALVALLDPSAEGAPASTEAYLQQVAKRGGMEYLVESTELRAPA